MWQASPMFYRLKGSGDSSIDELLVSSSRSLILVTGILYFVWHLAVTVYPEIIGWNSLTNILLIAPFILFSGGISLWQLEKRPLMANLLWGCGQWLVITLAVILFQESEIAYLYAFLPLLLTVMIGWGAGLIAEGVVILMIVILSAYGLGGMTPNRGIIIGLGGGLSWVLGWAVVMPLITAAKWSVENYWKAKQNMDEVREQQLQLRQAQEDLIKANQETARLSERLKRMYQEAEEARRIKEEFVSNVSHELRTPLNMIIGFSEMITQSPKTYGYKLPPALLADIGSIQRNSRHLAQLIDDVLDLSQVEAGRMALNKSWACIQDIIESASRSVMALYESKHLYLDIRVPDEPLHLYCDETRIRQVIINLLSNSGRFTKTGGVILSAWQVDNNLMLSVADTGPGIAPEVQQKLFEPFQQADGSIRREHGGSGLGLSICKRFIEMHGGKISLRSEVNVGTTITISLPIHPYMEETERANQPSRWFNPYLEYEPRSDRLRVSLPAALPRYVILEKEDNLRKLMERYMGEAEFISVRSIEEMKRALTGSPAQALVVNLPPQDVDRLAIKTKVGLPFGAPVFTCWVPGGADAARQYGARQYLVKPVTPQRFQEVIEEFGSPIKTILLVDDDAETLRLFVRMLTTDQKYRVLQARNGEVALKMMRERQPDLVFLDLVMEGMDGFAVLEKKNEDETIRDIPVIILTSRDPRGEPVLSGEISISCAGGLSLRDLIQSIQLGSEIFNPRSRQSDSVRIADSVG